MVIIHDEVENKMNKLVMLNEIRREKKESSLSVNMNINDELINNKEEYLNFRNQFCKDYFTRKTNNKGYSKHNNINLINVDDLNEAINKIFLLNNKKPFIDFVNEIFGDYLGTNCEVNYVQSNIKFWRIMRISKFCSEEHFKFWAEFFISSIEFNF